MKYLLLFCSVVVLASCSVDMDEEVALAYEGLTEEVDFNFHVRPILSDRCYKCHGPDEAARKADLRLDLPEAASAVLGNTRNSPLIQRILSQDPEQVMPPPESHLMLSAEEKAILVKWVEQGAAWKNHWAFISPEKPKPPKIPEEGWPAKNEVDHFIFERLSRKGLTPNPEADKERLLRRVTMDLSGLPPTIDEIKQFLKDSSENAYEAVVDRLLESPETAERLAMDWMDLSRYADSHGLHADGYRMMWPWRDWVIKAFLNNMPYDQFVTWQLAGDLIEEASQEQKLATAFNRNHPMTAEGGAIDEEFRLSYVFDRAETVGTAFLGLTMNCSRCHDHKFDPISQKDYYQFAAFFNNIKELGMTGDDGNYGPMLPLTDSESQEILEFIEKDIALQEQELGALTTASQQEVNPNVAIPPTVKPLVNVAFQSYRKPNADKNYLLDGNSKVTTPALPKLVPGKRGKALHFTGEYDEVYINGLPNFEWTEPFSGGMWLQTTKKDAPLTQTLMGTAGEKNNFWRGWDMYLDTLNRLNFRLIHSLPHNYVHVYTKDTIPLNTWTQVFFTYDGLGKGAGTKLYINGKPVSTTTDYDRLYRSIKTVGPGAHEITDRPLRIGKSYRSFTGENGVFKGELDEIQIYNQTLTSWEIYHIYNTQTGETKTTEDALLKAHQQAYDPAVIAKQKELRELKAQWMETMSTIPEVMVMEELNPTPVAFAYRRGAYDAPMYSVKPGTPQVLNTFDTSLPQNRLGLSQWLFQEDNPLTARVTVNRYWQMLFGNGLVKTPHDFGVQGALPTHPLLLDWLASYLKESNWDLKSLLKKMVMSHSYRQSSETSEEDWQKDPENKYLARGVTYRLPAEMIRDNALAASGLLVKKMGGESVRPYQPEGLWIEKGNFSHKLLRYKVTKGDSLYRRSIYTFVKRTSPHPAMTAFDAPNRDVCTVKRENTNTPLQALVLLNDPQFVECSRVLAQRIQNEATGLEQQIERAFQLVTGRRPKDQENQIFRELYSNQFAHFSEHPSEVKALMKVGDYPEDMALDPLVTAALTVVSNTILNHDEAYMKR